MTKLVPVFPYPFMLLKGKSSMLIVGDTHFGIEEDLKKKGISGINITNKFIDEVKYVKKETGAEEILFLGDIKNELDLKPESESLIKEIINSMKEMFERIVIIKGNHDGNIEHIITEKVEIYPSTGFTYNNIGFFHGHAWPDENVVNQKILVSGHVHPGIGLLKFNGKIEVKKCFAIGKANTKNLEKHYGKGKAKVKKIILVPAWNKYTGNSILNNPIKSQKGIVMKNNLLNINETKIYLLDSTYLGTLPFIH
ncbi:MAG: metallophosphoesterase [Thermoplasmata archaeon]